MIVDWFQSKSKKEEDVVGQFDRLWMDQEAGHSVTFISVVSNASETSNNIVDDMGLSIWSKNFLTHTTSQITHHWRIGESAERHTEANGAIEFGHSDGFDFGTTQPIMPDDISTIFDDWATSLSSNCEQLCVVVYGKEQMDIVKKYWTSTVPVVFVDLEIVWRLRCNGPPTSKFGEIASTIGDFAAITTDINHSGNQANCLIGLLQSLGGGE